MGMGQGVSERPGSWALVMGGGGGVPGCPQELTSRPGQGPCVRRARVQERRFSWSSLAHGMWWEPSVQAWVRVELTAMFTGS